MMQGSIKGIHLVLFALLLSACSSNSDFDDIQAFMDEVDSRPKGQIEALPPIKENAPFAYSAANLRSPFSPPEVIKPVKRDPNLPQVKPDFNRVKQFLEQFDVNQLKMVGTLSQGPHLYALINDPNGGVHRVQTNDYLGQDFGRITSVDENKIELTEIVTDGTGGWVQRERTMSLGGGEE